MTQTTQTSANAAQIDYWNAAAGETWVRFHESLDRQIESLGWEAARVLAPRAGERLLDIGCGCGQTALELAALVGPTGSVLGVDISAPMLAVAARRARPATSGAVELRKFDAQCDAFEPAAFDAAFSRFGVMFFSDPTAAFANIRSALKPGGRIAFVCWRALADNPWMSIPLEAARPLLPPSTPSDPAAPGPFAFADAGRVRAILGDAGFESIVVTPYDTLLGGGTVEQALDLALRLGPLGAVLRENRDCVSIVAPAVAAALRNHVTESGVRMKGAVWIVSARNG